MALGVIAIMYDRHRRYVDEGRFLRGAGAQESDLCYELSRYRDHSGAWLGRLNVGKQAAQKAARA